MVESKRMTCKCITRREENNWHPSVNEYLRAHYVLISLGRRTHHARNSLSATQRWLDFRMKMTVRRADVMCCISDIARQ